VDLHTFSFPTTIHFGAGSTALLGGHLRDRGCSRPLVVTDVGVAPLPFFDGLLTGLREAGLDPEVSADVIGNPVLAHVRGAADAFSAHGADCVVGVGGGAALDVAKVVGLVATHPGELFDYEDGRADALPIDDRLPHFVAVPTTAGTGSEVGRSSVISDDAHVKRIIFSPHLLAKAVFADPVLTVGLPPAITAATGVDALTHNVEAYLALGYHPICDGIALQGVRLAAMHLADAVADGKDLEARAGMLMASMMGAIAFQKGLGAVHSTAHALGTVVDLHHGLANALMIDHVLPFNAEVVPDRFADLAAAAGAPQQDAAGFLHWLTALKATIGVPAGLRDAGVDVGNLDRLVDVAFADSCHLLNPRPVTAGDLRHLFERAFA
jgi:alcohol dehydrogenase class IV